MLSTAIAVSGDSLEQRLAKRGLLLRHAQDGQTLPEVLAALSADYKARYNEPLRIYIAAELLVPSGAVQPKPAAPPPKIPDLVPGPDAVRIDGGPIRVPVIELLRYYATFADIAFTIQGDVVLFHAKPK